MSDRKYDKPWTHEFDQPPTARNPWQVRTLHGDKLTAAFDTQREATNDMAQRNQRAQALGLTERYRTNGPVWFCCGPFCPGMNWRPSEMPGGHPASCVAPPKFEPDEGTLLDDWHPDEEEERECDYGDGECFDDALPGPEAESF